MAVWTRKWKVTSFTNYDKEYVVSEGTGLVLGVQASTWGCSCGGWRFKKVDPVTGRRPDCKHILSTRGTLQREKSIELTQETRELLSQWAVVELTSLPDLGTQVFGERSI